MAGQYRSHKPAILWATFAYAALWRCCRWRRIRSCTHFRQDKLRSPRLFKGKKWRGNAHLLRCQRPQTLVSMRRRAVDTAAGPRASCEPTGMGEVKAVAWVQDICRQTSATAMKASLSPDGTGSDGTPQTLGHPRGPVQGGVCVTAWRRGGRRPSRKLVSIGLFVLSTPVSTPVLISAGR